MQPKVLFIAHVENHLLIQTQKGILFALRKDHISKKRKYRHLERWMLKID